MVRRTRRVGLGVLVVTVTSESESPVSEFRVIVIVIVVALPLARGPGWGYHSIIGICDDFAKFYNFTLSDSESDCRTHLVSH